MKLLTGGKRSSRTKPATPSADNGMGLTWCNSKADGIVRMEEDHHLIIRELCLFIAAVGLFG